MCKCTKEFTIRFAQTLVKEITIMASDIDQALDIAEDMAGNGDVEWTEDDIASCYNPIDYDVYD